jgi:hypothetical protein
MNCDIDKGGSDQARAVLGGIGRKGDRSREIYDKLLEDEEMKT